MRKLSVVITALGLATLLAVGCSSNEAESAAQSDQTQTQTQTQATQVSEKDTDTGDPIQDSLAAIRHPIRDENNPIVTINTDFGNMTLELYRDVAPAHADSFVARTKDGFYDGLTFHRIIDGFMIQGGDPKGDGTGGAGYNLPAEFSDLPHKDGTLSMARARSPHSASSQFFICLARQRALDNQYTVFGQLLKGYDVLHEIGKVKVVKQPHGEMSKPAETVYMRELFVSDKEGNPIK